MQPTKNNPIDAELTFNYQLYPDASLIIGNAQQAQQLFLKLWECQSRKDGWYVLFLGTKQQFMCWHYLQNFMDTALTVKNIMGTAISINAKQVVVGRMDNEDTAKLTHLDILWISYLLRLAKKRKITFKNYLVLGLNNWCHFLEGEEEFIN